MPQVCLCPPGFDRQSATDADENDEQIGLKVRSGDDREPIRLTNIDAFVKLSSNVTKWASFGYDYKLKIQPQLVDRAQQIHMFVVNVNYNLF